MTLHREGKTIIPVSFLIIAAIVGLTYYFTKDCCIWVAYLLGTVGLVFFGLVLNFFRSPSFTVPVNPNHLISPCDGKVVVIEEVQDDVYFKGKVRQISIFMSPLNVHINRNPISGTVKHAEYIKGEFLVAFDPKSSERNERTFIVVQNEKTTVAFKQIAGYVARRICYYVKPGDKVQQGEEFGFIKFGSRIDILMPLSCKVKVNLEEVVWGGRSVIAEIE
ncbi:MAG: phosphatidylserine decarboxylase family protein [Bacteroidia bacterium]